MLSHPDEGRACDKHASRLTPEDSPKSGAEPGNRDGRMVQLALGIVESDRTEGEWGRAFKFYQGFDVDKGVDDIGASVAALLPT